MDGGIVDTSDPDAFHDALEVMEEIRREREDTLAPPDDDLPDEETSSFDFDEYTKEHKMEKIQDFDKYAKSHDLTMKNMPILVQLKILNTGSHFSEDKFNIAVLYAVLLLIFVALAAVNWKKYKEDRAKFEDEDSPLYFTFGSLNMVVAHCVLKCLHNFYYAYDGIGSMLCEMIAHIMLVFSRITMITILIAFAFGWQVIYENTKEVKQKI